MNRVQPSFVRSLRLAHELARLPQAALRNDRRSALEQWSVDWGQATLNEFRLGIATVATGGTEAGARRFAAAWAATESPCSGHDPRVCCTKATCGHD